MVNNKHKSPVHKNLRQKGGKKNTREPSIPTPGEVPTPSGFSLMQGPGQKRGKVFHPTEMQERFLKVCLDPFNPPRSWREALARLNLSPEALTKWFKQPGFIEWWNQAYIGGAQIFASSALHELINIIHDESTAKSIKVRAIREYLDRFSAEQQRWERETALRALVEALTPSARKISEQGGKIGFAIKEHPDMGVQVVAQVQPDQELTTPKVIQHNVTYRKPAPEGPALTYDPLEDYDDYEPYPAPTPRLRLRLTLRQDESLVTPPLPPTEPYAPPKTNPTTPQYPGKANLYAAPVSGFDPAWSDKHLRSEINVTSTNTQHRKPSPWVKIPPKIPRAYDEDGRAVENHGRSIWRP